MSKITKTSKPIKKVVKPASNDENDEDSENERISDVHTSEQITNNLDNLANEVKQAQTKLTITPDNYSFRFGKYSGLLAKDVKNLKKLNKYGKVDPTGIKCIMSLLNCEWLNASDKDILTKVIEMK